MQRFIAFSFALLIVTACATLPQLGPADPPAIATATSERTRIPTVVPVPTSTGDASPSPELPSAVTYGGLARQHLQAIAGEIGQREPGTAEERQTAQYIQSVFAGLGYSPEIQEFSVYDEEEDEEFTSANVIAVKPGLSERVLVVGAHYDSAYERGSYGADDNASGVAVLLESAELLKELETPYTLQFVAFGAEEFDLDGSYAFVERLSRAERQAIVGMVNLDSLIAGDKTYVYGNAGPGTLRDWVLEDAIRWNFDLEGRTAAELNNPDGSPCECADYDAFESAGIPFAYFEATNWDLAPDAMTQVDLRYGDRGKIRHTEYDTIEYIDATFPGRIDHHLNLFVTLLVDLLSGYGE